MTHSNNSTADNPALINVGIIKPPKYGWSISKFVHCLYYRYDGHWVQVTQNITYTKEALYQIIYLGKTLTWLGFGSLLFQSPLKCSLFRNFSKGLCFVAGIIRYNQLKKRKTKSFAVAMSGPKSKVVYNVSHNLPFSNNQGFWNKYLLKPDSGVYLVPCQTSMIELYTKLVNG